MSTQGRLWAVTEATLNALRSPYSHLLHASVALRAVPGEFDLVWVGKITQAANAQPPQSVVMEPEDIQQRLAALSEVLASAESRVSALAAQAQLPALQQALVWCLKNR